MRYSQVRIYCRINLAANLEIFYAAKPSTLERNGGGGRGAHVRLRSASAAKHRPEEENDGDGIRGHSAFEASDHHRTEKDAKAESCSL